MKAFSTVLSATLLAAVIGGCSQPSQEAREPQREEYMFLQTVERDFDEIWDNLQLTVEGRGIKINNISHIGRMLSRTADAVGASEEVFIKAKVVEFCSSTISRETMEADPHNIVFCPYIISVYVTAAEPNKTHIAFRRPLKIGSERSKQSLQAVEDLLKSIVKETLET